MQTDALSSLGAPPAPCACPGCGWAPGNTSAFLRERSTGVALLACVACGNAECEYNAAGAGCDVPGCCGAAVAFFRAARGEAAPAVAPCLRCGAPTALCAQARAELRVARSARERAQGAQLYLQELVVLQQRLGGEEEYALKCASDVQDLERLACSPAGGSRSHGSGSAGASGRMGCRGVAETPVGAERTPYPACPSVFVPSMPSTARDGSATGSGTDRGGQQAWAAGGGGLGEDREYKRRRTEQGTERQLAFTPALGERASRPSSQRGSQRVSAPAEAGTAAAIAVGAAARSPTLMPQQSEGWGAAAAAIASSPLVRTCGYADGVLTAGRLDSSPEVEADRRLLAEVLLDDAKRKLVYAVEVPAFQPPSVTPPPTQLCATVVAASALFPSAAEGDGVSAATRAAVEQVKLWYRRREAVFQARDAAERARLAYETAMEAAKAWRKERAQRGDQQRRFCAGKLLVNECRLLAQRAEREWQASLGQHAAALPAIRAELEWCIAMAGDEDVHEASMWAIAAAAGMWRSAHSDIVAAAQRCVCEK